MDKILNLHKKYSKGPYKEKFVDLIYTHSLIVYEISLELSKNLEKQGIYVNTKLLKQGCLLHDIGVYSCDFFLFNEKSTIPYLHHGFIGRDILLKEGYSNKVARFAVTHTGVGLSKQDIIKNSIPVKKKDYIPITLEEELLCYADKFHTKTLKFSNFKEQKSKLSRFGNEKAFTMDYFKQKFGEPDLAFLSNKYSNWHKEMNEFINSNI